MHISGENISLAYLKSLERVVQLNQIFALMVEIEKPLTSFNPLGVNQRFRGLNLDPKLHNKFEIFQFCDGKKGSWWIDNRINELLKGIYYKGITNFNQLNFVQETLRKIKSGKYTWSSNRLLCLTFDPHDKHLNHVHSERQPVPPCLTLIDFKPEKDKLHLIASWRAQYFDTKAYGNFISLAILLREVCENTKYNPGRLISIANKAILKDKRDGKRLLQNLKTN